MKKIKIAKELEVGDMIIVEIMDTELKGTVIFKDNISVDLMLDIGGGANFKLNDDVTQWKIVVVGKDEKEASLYGALNDTFIDLDKFEESDPEKFDEIINNPISILNMFFDNIPDTYKGEIDVITNYLNNHTITDINHEEEE